MPDTWWTIRWFHLPLDPLVHQLHLIWYQNGWKSVYSSWTVISCIYDIQLYFCECLLTYTTKYDIRKWCIIEKNTALIVIPTLYDLSVLIVWLTVVKIVGWFHESVLNEFYSIYVSSNTEKEQGILTFLDACISIWCMINTQCILKSHFNN